MDTTQAKQIASEWLAANAPNVDCLPNIWSDTIVSATVKHPEDPRHSVTIEVRRPRLGKCYDDSEGNTWSKSELKFTANWSAYGSVSIEAAAAHLAVMEAALVILMGLKSILPTEIEEIADTAEDKALRVAKREEESVRTAALTYVAENKLTHNMRAYSTKRIPTALADTLVTYDSRGKVYTVEVSKGWLTVSRTQ